MDSYRVSKAWHISHLLAAEIHELVLALPESERELAGQLRQASVAAYHSLAMSVGKELQKEKLKHYGVARDAAIELQGHLLSAREKKHITADTFQDMAGRAIETQQIMTGLIRKVSRELAGA